MSALKTYMAAPETAPSPSRLRQAWRKHRLFWLTVALPTVLATLYYGLIAADVYVSESRFVVRSPERQASSPLGMLLKGSGFTRAQDDTYTVQEYILSRDALQSLDDKLNLRAAFAKGDAISRFPGLSWDDSFEHMHRYYQDVVTIRLDSMSSIGTLSVRAYTAQDAQAINAHLLQKAEELVNQLNERGRQDMIRFATEEVARAETRAKRAALALASYRNKKGVIDPELQSAIPLQQIAKLQDELISSKAQLIQLQLAARDNPQIPFLHKRIQLLENEIRSESQKLTGDNGTSLASKAADYQRLALEKEFADKQLASVMASLELARNEAQRQQLYLERISQPSLPDAALEPRRLRWIAAVFVLGLMLWGVLSMLVAGIKEHQD